MTGKVTSLRINLTKFKRKLKPVLPEKKGRLEPCWVQLGWNGGIFNLRVCTLFKNFCTSPHCQYPAVEAEERIGKVTWCVRVYEWLSFETNRSSVHTPGAKNPFPTAWMQLSPRSLPPSLSDISFLRVGVGGRIHHSGPQLKRSNCVE